MKLFKRILLISVALGIIYCATVLFQIIYHANYSTPEKSDTIIVLGCQIWGKSPSLLLEYRLKKALELYKSGYASYIIVSGGQGKDEVYPESTVMKNWLVSHGISDTRIIEENKSTSTFENLKFSKKMMDINYLKTALIISNNFHIYRSLRISKILGMKASGGPAPTVNYLVPYYYSREVLSVTKSYLLDR